MWKPVLWPWKGNAMTLAHIDYWRRVRKLQNDIPSLRFSIINLHPAKQENLPADYDGVVDRKNDIIYHDRTEFDENIAILMSYLVALVNTLIKLAEEKGANKEELQKILKEKTKGIFSPLASREHMMI